MPKRQHEQLYPKKTLTTPHQACIANIVGVHSRQLLATYVHILHAATYSQLLVSIMFHHGIHRKVSRNWIQHQQDASWQHHSLVPQMLDRPSRLWLVAIPVALRYLPQTWCSSRHHVARPSIPVPFQVFYASCRLGVQHLQLVESP